MNEQYDHTPTIMPGGTMTTGAEIHETGIASYASNFDKEQAVNRLRTQKMVDGFSAANNQNAYAGTYASSGPSKSINPKVLVAVLGMLLIAFVAFTTWQSAAVRMPWHFGVFQVRGYVLGPKDVAVMRDMNKLHYKALFNEAAPLDDLFKGCQFKNCIDPDWPAFKRMLPYALNPATFENDVCAFMFEREQVPYSADLPKPLWSIGPPLPDKLKANSCVLMNKDAIWEGVKKHRTAVNTKVALGFGLAALLFLFLLFRTSKVAKVEKA